MVFKDIVGPSAQNVATDLLTGVICSETLENPMKQCRWNTQSAGKWPEDKCGLVEPHSDCAVTTSLAVSFGLRLDLVFAILFSVIPITCCFFLPCFYLQLCGRAACAWQCSTTPFGPHLLPLDHQVKPACIIIINVLIFNTIRSGIKTTAGLEVFHLRAINHHQPASFILFVFP